MLRANLAAMMVVSEAVEAQWAVPTLESDLDTIGEPGGDDMGDISEAGSVDMGGAPDADAGNAPEPANGIHFKKRW